MKTLNNFATVVGWILIGLWLAGAVGVLDFRLYIGAKKVPTKNVEVIA